MNSLKKYITIFMMITLSLNGCQAFNPVTVCTTKQDCDVKAVEKPGDFMLSVGVTTFLAGMVAITVICAQKNKCNNK